MIQFNLILVPYQYLHLTTILCSIEKHILFRNLVHMSVTMRAKLPYVYGYHHTGMGPNTRIEFFLTSYTYSHGAFLCDLFFI